jgi:hypothetical protein
MSLTAPLRVHDSRNIPLRKHNSPHLLCSLCNSAQYWLTVSTSWRSPRPTSLPQFFGIAIQLSFVFDIFAAHHSIARLFKMPSVNINPQTPQEKYDLSMSITPHQTMESSKTCLVHPLYTHDQKHHEISLLCKTTANFCHIVVSDLQEVLGADIIKAKLEKGVCQWIIQWAHDISDRFSTGNRLSLLGNCNNRTVGPAKFIWSTLANIASVLTVDTSYPQHKSLLSCALDAVSRFCWLMCVDFNLPMPVIC